MCVQLGCEGSDYGEFLEDLLIQSVIGAGVQEPASPCAWEESPSFQPWVWGLCQRGKVVFLLVSYRIALCKGLPYYSQTPFIPQTCINDSKGKSGIEFSFRTGQGETNCWEDPGNLLGFGKFDHESDFTKWRIGRALAL